MTPDRWKTLLAGLAPLRRRRTALMILTAAVAFTVVAALDPRLRLPERHGLDKLAHIGAFTVLAALSALAWPERRWPWRTALGLATFSLAIEVAQGFDPGRDASLLDAGASLIGVLAGSTVGQLTYRLRE